MGEYLKVSSSSEESHRVSPQTAVSPQAAAVSPEQATQQRSELNQLAAPDTERSQPLDVLASHSQFEKSSRVASEFSGVKNRPAEQLTVDRPAPAARELDLHAPAAALGSAQAAPAQEGGHHTTLQSMIRPDLMNHGLSDPRRFLSIERELSENSAATRFLEKRLNRAEKDSRVALALAGVALLLAALSYVL